MRKTPKFNHNSCIRIAFSFLCVVTALCQRGCPMEACDPRGLNSQGDFQVTSKDASVLWTVPVGNVSQFANASYGCVGDDQNIVCKGVDINFRETLLSISLDGKVRWTDDTMVTPQLPAMNQQGDIISTDGDYLELRRADGSMVGKPIPFIGSLRPVSSVHWVHENALFFFVSYKTGLLLLYDMSGACVASYTVVEKNQTTNESMVWIPINKLVVNQEMNPLTAYIIFQNNSTKKYRLYAVSINNIPPYLREKWFLDITADLDELTMASVPLLAYNNYVFMGIGNDLPSTSIIQDLNDKPVVTSLEVAVTAFALLDQPALKRSNDDMPIVWMGREEATLATTIAGWNNSDGGYFQYECNLSELLQFEIVMLTSNMMALGYHPENVTLIFAATALNFENKSSDNKPGNYIIALKVNEGDELELLWKMYMGMSGGVVGQIIGVNDNLLIAYMLDDINAKILGIKVA